MNDRLADVARQIAIHHMIWLAGDEPYPSQATLAWMDSLIDLLGRERIEREAQDHVLSRQKRRPRR